MSNCKMATESNVFLEYVCLKHKIHESIICSDSLRSEIEKRYQNLGELNSIEDIEA